MLLVVLWGFIAQCAQKKSRGTDPLSKRAAQIATGSNYGSDHPDGHYGIKILNIGPTGSKYTNSKRGEFGLLIFCIQILNDTIIPFDLDIQFPSKPIPLLPDSIVKVELFILPDFMIPDTTQNTANFAVIGIEDYFNSDSIDPGILKTTIQPQEHHTMYLGMLNESNMGYGTIRAQLFINGQEIEAPFMPVTSIETDQRGYKSLDLIYGIGYSPHNQHILIPCGQIIF